MYITKFILAVSATFALTATALPAQSNDGVVDSRSEPSLYIAPGFIADPDATEPVAHHHLQSRFDKPFMGAHQMEFMCEGGSLGKGSTYRAKASDCETALEKLVGMNGHWDCTGWTDGQNLRYFVLFEYGTCKAYVMADADKMIRWVFSPFLFFRSFHLPIQTLRTGRICAREGYGWLTMNTPGF